jgi:hypothetical protein
MHYHRHRPEEDMSHSVLRIISVPNLTKIHRKVSQIDRQTYVTPSFTCSFHALTNTKPTSMLKYLPSRYFFIVTGVLTNETIHYSNKQENVFWFSQLVTSNHILLEHSSSLHTGEPRVGLCKFRSAVSCCRWTDLVIHTIGCWRCKLICTCLLCRSPITADALLINFCNLMNMVNQE